MAALFDSPKIHPGSDPSIKWRPLQIGDYDRGYLRLLGQLTKAPEVPLSLWEETFQKMRSSGLYFTVVAEDVSTGKIVACATLLAEHKFIRGCGAVGHVEDVVVDKVARGKSLGLKVIEHLKDVARAIGCYKLILDCSQDNVKFYERCGLKVKELQMAVYFPENEGRRPKL
uniref:Glucosamine 6-phosphate N-acetyltransferase n=1 Tax=Hemiselmis andersenii TaxID=464988 RepID=A0A6T8N8Z3_HEMAN|mmetsp:Transcript_26344/g.61041  ORF Transcript_26344/g.61041 Transcript_26344/m.61041 type:complete len:171 (-) Transcript_26344:72-584(-)